MKKSELRQLIEEEIKSFRDKKKLNEAKVFNKVTLSLPEAVSETIKLIDMMRDELFEWMDAHSSKKNQGKMAIKNYNMIQRKFSELEKVGMNLLDIRKEIQKPVVFKKIEVKIS